MFRNVNGKMNCYIIGVAAVVLMIAGVVQADTFLPGDSSVNYSANADGFYVNPTGLDLYGSNSWASSYTYSGSNPLFGLQAGANSGAYSDAGIVLYFAGSLKLGQLQSVTIIDAGGSNTTPIVNLWLDTGGNGNFFDFSGSTFTGLNGDAYFGATASGNIGAGTTFGYLGGPGAYGEYTLAQLQSGARAGIDADTAVALWIGLTNGSSYWDYNMANIARVDVQTQVPEPSTLFLLGAGLLGLVAAWGKKLRSIKQ